MTPEQFRQYGHQLIDLIADYRQSVGERPVMAQVEPGYLKAQLPQGAPQQGEPFEAILDDVNQLVMPGLSHWQHPDFYGYFPSNGTLSSVLGDFLSTGLGVLAIQPGAERAGRNHPRLAAPAAWPVGPVERGDSGHRIHQHPGGADQRP